MKPTSSVQPGSGRTPAQNDAAEREAVQREEYTVTVRRTSGAEDLWVAEISGIATFGVTDADALAKLVHELYRRLVHSGRLAP